MIPKAATRAAGLNAAVAAIYALLAWGAGLISVDGTGVLPFMPAAGVAAVAAVRLGWSIVPGIWLGSFLFKLHAFSGDTTIETVAVAALAGFGSAFQAWVAGTLVRRTVGAASTLDDGPSIIRFMLYAGPIGCLVAATLGTTVLSVAGRFPLSDYPVRWLNWWAGDSLGVLVAAPPLHLLLTRAHGRVWRRCAIVTLPALAAAVATLLGLFSVATRQSESAVAAFEKEATALVRGVENTLHGHGVVLESLRSYFQTVGTVSREQFRDFAFSIMSQEPGISALVWAPVIPPGEQRAWHSRAVADGVRAFAWKGRDESGAVVEVSDPGDGPVIYYIEPAETNSAAMGYALRHTPEAWEAIREGIRTGSSRGTGRVRLVQARGDEWGAVIYAPLYTGPGIPLSPDLRNERFRGVVSIVVRLEEFLEYGLGDFRYDHLFVRLTDLAAPPEEAELATFGLPLHDPERDAGLAWSTEDLDFGGRRWRLDIVQHRDAAGTGSSGTLLVLGCGMLFTGLLASFMLLVTGHTRRVEELVERRTEELRREVDVRRAAEEASLEARARAENANAAKSRFLAAVSHEIRTPINAIIGMSELMVGSKLPPEQRDFADTIMKAGNGLLAIVNDILDLARIEAGRMDLRNDPFGPAHLMEEIQALFRLRAAERGLTLRFEIDPALPSRLRGDSARVRQVLINLVANAVKFTHSGEIVVGAKLASQTPDRVLLRFEVADTGPGISPDDLPRLFEPFTQLKLRPATEGTGLGLAICNQLVGLMKGGIAVESNEGDGTRFTVTIPFAPCPEDVESGSAVSSGNVGFSELSVLVAEDNAVNRKVAGKMLERIGVRAVEFANDGAEAVERLAQAHYSLVLMDCDMPNMDGLEATRRIREREGDRRRARIVAMTAHAMEGDRERCLGAGMDDYLQKPVTLEALRQCLREAQADEVRRSG